MVNPANLKSLVDQHSAGPSAAQLGMAPPAAAPEGDEDDDLDDEEPEAAETGAARGNQLIEGWGEFGKALKEEGAELHDLAHDAGAGLLLKEPDEDAIKAVEKAVDKMPDDLSMGFAKYISKLSPEDCHALAEALAPDAEADVNLLASFIIQAGKYAGEEIDVDDDFNEPEEDEESDKKDETEAKGGDKPADPPAAPPAGGGDHGSY